jgi:hypothetical protein
MSILVRTAVIFGSTLGVSCSYTETYQEEVHRRLVDQMIAETIHERNFRIWKEKQRGYVGMTSFKQTSPCPDWSMHGAH